MLCLAYRSLIPKQFEILEQEMKTPCFKVPWMAYDLFDSLSPHVHDKDTGWYSYDRQKNVKEIIQQFEQKEKETCNVPLMSYSKKANKMNTST